MTARPTLISRCALTAVAAATLLLSACADMGHIKPQAHMLDPNSLGAGKEITSAHGPIEWPKAAWWNELHDAQLDQLLTTALADNPTLHVAEARVRQAESITGVYEEATKPHAELSGSLNREKYAAYGTVPPPLNNTWQWRSELTLSGGFDLDLWGRNRSALAGALDDVQMTAAESQLARLQLEGSIVRSYIQLSLQYQVQDIVRDTLQQRRNILAITQRRAKAGLGTEFDVTLVETALPAAERELEQSEEEITLLRNQLAALCGKGPAAGESIARPTLQLDHALSLPSALPAELVGRRPDIAAHRWRVEAEGKRINVSKAAFYPNINLLFYTGLESFSPTHFFDTNAQTHGIAPAFSLPIFAGERLRGQLGSQTAIYDGAVEQYNATVVHALQDVADAITRARSLQQQDVLTRQSLALAQKAHTLADKAYRAGMTDSINALNAQVTLLREEETRAQISARQLGVYAELMTALGGGVEITTPEQQAAAGADAARHPTTHLKQ
jgi:NodT family efflux transporter outer membrane factor (OMF) lipoprotein